MLISFFRIIKYGIQGFVRNGWLSVSTISIMILTLVVFEGLILFNFIGKTALQSIKGKVDISVYFKSNVSEDSILAVKRSVEALDEVQFVEYVSKEEALADFKAQHAEDETLVQTLDELDENPLLASVNIKAKELEEYGTIASYLETPSLNGLVEKVTYAQNKTVIDRLLAWIRTINKAVIVLSAFMTFLAVVVTFNTIRLAIFANSEQISIMRLVGASNSFIRGPFMIEGVLYGVIATVVSFIALIPVVDLTSPYLSSFIHELDIRAYFNANWARLLFYQFGIALSLSVVSSFIAVRRYLRI